MKRNSQSQGKLPKGCVDFYVRAQSSTCSDGRRTEYHLRVVKYNNFTTEFDREAESGFCAAHMR